MVTFKSDLALFSTDITKLLEIKYFPPIREILVQKQFQETESDRPAEDKKNDLLIWNGVLCREVVKLGIYKGTLHTLYNRFYDKIRKCGSLKELQELELSLFEAYIKGMVYDTETTEHYSVNKILQYIHISLENHISLKSIAKSVGLSEGYVSKTFKKIMGKSVMMYVKEIKIERAKTYLLDRVLTVSEIADLLGFYDNSHFSRVFKDICGVTPMEFRIKQGFI